MIARILSLTAVAAIAVTALAGCAAQDTPGTRSAVAPEQLVGTWTVDAVLDAPEQPYITFSDDGSWSSSDGCNRVQGTWELGENGALDTTSGPSTLMACPGAQLPLAVAQADFVIVDGDTLTIYSTAESTATTLVRTDDPNIGPLGLPIGQWVDAERPDEVFLSLAADGTFGGNDGCNVLSGSWEVTDDESVVFSEVASTLRFCEGVDTWLATVATGRVQSGVMTLQDVDGGVIGQLVSQ